MTAEDEKKKLANLLASGFGVQVVNPLVERFNEKYAVWQNMFGTARKTVIISEQGDVVGLQG